MNIGIGQLLIILVIVFIVFGAGRMPQVMADLGKGLRAFRENLHGKDDQNQKKLDKDQQD